MPVPRCLVRLTIQSVFDTLDRVLRESGMMPPEPAPGDAEAMRRAGPRSPNFPHIVQS